MDNNEQLYINLMMDHMPEDCEARGLITQGYLTQNMQFTEKAINFVNYFIDSKKHIVYQAIKELGPEARKSQIMSRSNISQMGILSDVVNRLVKESRVKKENGKFYVVE